MRRKAWRVRKDGTPLLGFLVVTALHDRRGELRGFAKITRDLTARRQREEAARVAAAEQAARRQAELDENEMRRSRDQLDLILREHRRGRDRADAGRAAIVFANEVAARLCGFDVGAALLAAIPRQILARFEVFREDGTPVPARSSLPGGGRLRASPPTPSSGSESKATGEERWSFVSGGPRPRRQGKMDLAVSVFREFTERRRTEQAWQFLADASAALASSLDYQATLKLVAELAVPRSPTGPRSTSSGPTARSRSSRSRTSTRPSASWPRSGARAGLPGPRRSPIK